MILQFEKEKIGCKSRVGLVKYKLDHVFDDWYAFPDSLNLTNDDYEELGLVNNLVFINDVTNDDWLKQYHVDMIVPSNRDSILMMKRVMQQAEDGDND